MNDSSKVWLPSGLPPATAHLLSVPDPGKPMTPGLYREMLVAKIDQLIQADPKAARQAMEMSQDEAPELWAIAEQFPASQWASALVRSDQMQALLSQTTGEGKLATPHEHSLGEILELLA